MDIILFMILITCIIVYVWELEMGVGVHISISDNSGRSNTLRCVVTCDNQMVPGAFFPTSN